MIVEEIRLENLKSLISEFKSAAEVARITGVPASYLSQVLTRVESRTGKPRDIGSPVARKLETGCGKPRGWMDHDHSDVGLEQFRQLPPEVRAWLMRQGNTPNEQKNNGTQ